MMEMLVPLSLLKEIKKKKIKNKRIKKCLIQRGNFNCFYYLTLNFYRCKCWDRKITEIDLLIPFWKSAGDDLRGQVKNKLKLQF